MTPPIVVLYSQDPQIKNHTFEIDPSKCLCQNMDLLDPLSLNLKRFDLRDSKGASKCLLFFASFFLLPLANVSVGLYSLLRKKGKKEWVEREKEECG